MSKIRVVVGGQFGSESKGRTTGFLSQEDVSPEPQMVLRIGGPQAGHIVTGRGPDGPEHHWKLRSVPVAAVTRKDAVLAIASGSEVDPVQLNKELELLFEYGYDPVSRLVIDPAATWMTPEHKQSEVDSSIVGRIGSTATGVGAARCDRIMRTADLTADHGAEFGSLLSKVPVRDLVKPMLRRGGTVTVEAAQGCHLDLYRGPYPFGTSGRTTAIDALSAAEIVPWGFLNTDLQVWIAARTTPIRVGGNSGPLKGEQTWDDIGVPEERTTVTNRVRRVGTWDPEQVRQSVKWCGGAPVVRLSISHLDYLFPEVAEFREWEDFEMSVEGRKALDWIKKAEDDTHAYVGLIGVSPSRTIVYREDLL